MSAAGGGGVGPEARPGVVELVGAGPGDPELLTLRAEAALGAALTVVTDAAVAGLARAFAPHAEVVVTAAGGADRATVDRDVTVDGDTVAVLTGAARWGRPVVRLYRGDPWLHPAYAVESAILASAGVRTVTVPGPAVELAVPAVAGIPVHHRPTAVSVTVAPPHALPSAAGPGRTLVAVSDDAAGLVARLDGAAGRAGVAVVTVHGSTATVHRGSPGALAASPVIGPGVVVVGGVTGVVTGGEGLRDA
ncbi:MAG TPA: SAM-dependent methyltransferase [Acidimicrobiales bacterium]|nr:SAM-dependent methyltransferase [Acidimicrobiales bacterium]